MKTISGYNYRLIFQKAPPRQEPNKIDGSVFRNLVALWLFLNEDATKADLYREFCGKRYPKKVDYRLFTGQIKTVPLRWEQIMWRKFVDAGLDRQTVENWMNEFRELEHRERVPYNRIRPILLYLQEKLNIHPSFLLNQSFNRYESGMLKSVSRSVNDQVLKLKAKTEKVLLSKSDIDIERIKEEIQGKKDHYTLYLEIEEELQFLMKHAQKPARQYLGRGTKIYQTGQSKRIASWRADKIRADCHKFILENREYPLSDLPKYQQAKWIASLNAVFKFRIVHLLSKQEGVNLEKRILTPSYARDEYRKHVHGFTPFDMASIALGMKKKAFDLMVSNNCEIFKMVGIFTDRWYLPDLYFKELSEKTVFKFIVIKYEFMVKEGSYSSRGNICMVEGV